MTQTVEYTSEQQKHSTTVISLLQTPFIATIYMYNGINDVEHGRGLQESLQTLTGKRARNSNTSTYLCYN